ncbi:MAG: tocopherol cyclase family protein [Clostridiales bacterium]|nr:tocopherol cyclase family protein [Clostridiales bacterium]
MRHGFFDGWYFKQENTAHTLCVIVARHRARGGALGGSVQVFASGRPQATPAAINCSLPTAHCSLSAERGSATFFFPAEAMRWAHPKRGVICMGENRFSAEGLRLDLRDDGQEIAGDLRFSSPALPAYDIMGPFACVPFLECRHRVLTLCHRADGQILWNGQAYNFDQSPAYAEGDCGSSFPRRYLWTHAAGRNWSLMLSVADVPTLFGTFRGVAGFVYLNGKELRVATYCGARAEALSCGGAAIRQGQWRLAVTAAEPANARTLLAPARGCMTRLVRESPRLPVRVLLTRGDDILIDEVCESASFESGD